jgi:hypothetical protein
MKRTRGLVVHVSTAGGLLTQLILWDTLPVGRRGLVFDTLREHGDDEMKEEDAVMAGAAAIAADEEAGAGAMATAEVAAA